MAGLSLSVFHCYIFFDMLDISAYNAFVIWMAVNKDWNRGKLQRRRLFLDELGKALVRPKILQRQCVPRTPASAAIVRRIQEENSGTPSTRPTEPPSAKPEVSVWCCCSKCLTFMPCKRERGVSSFFWSFQLGCGQQQQKEAVQSLWTQVGQENSIHMQQV